MKLGLTMQTLVEIYQNEHPRVWWVILQSIQGRNKDFDNKELHKIIPFCTPLEHPEAIIKVHT